ncbi:MAG: hypothetical protein ACKPAH_14010, partial [Verrucomicrobiota bacterium]
MTFVLMVLGATSALRAVELPARVSTGPMAPRAKSLPQRPPSPPPQVRLRLEAPDLSVIRAEDATARQLRPKGRARVGLRRRLPEPVGAPVAGGAWALGTDGTRVW